MRRSVVRILLLAVLCVCMVTMAVAESWVCPNCGYVMNGEATEEAETAETPEEQPEAEESAVEETAVPEYQDESSVVVSS